MAVVIMFKSNVGDINNEKLKLKTKRKIKHFFFLEFYQNKNFREKLRKIFRSIFNENFQIEAKKKKKKEASNRFLITLA